MATANAIAIVCDGKPAPGATCHGSIPTMGLVVGAARAAAAKLGWTSYVLPAGGYKGVLSPAARTRDLCPSCSAARAAAAAKAVG